MPFSIFYLVPQKAFFITIPGISERDDDLGNRLRMIDSVTLPGAASAGATGGIDAFVLCPNADQDDADWDCCVADIFGEGDSAADVPEVVAPLRNFYEGRIHNALVHEHSMKSLKQGGSPASGYRSGESSQNSSGSGTNGSTVSFINDELHEVLVESGIHPGSSIKSLLDSFNTRYSTLSKYNRSDSGKAVYSAPSRHNTRIQLKANKLNDKA